MKRIRGLQPEVPPLAPLPPSPETLSVAWRWIAVSILLLYIALSACHAAYTPVLPANSGSLINAPDEPAHWGYARVLATEGRLPRQGDPTYEWHQPPLYYALIAPLFRAGPHAARWLTILMGLASVCLIFLATRRLFPSDPVLAVLAMGSAAFLPMRQAVYASVGNDALLELLCSACFLALVPAFTHGFTARRAAVVGLILGAALLTKANAVLLVFLVLNALLFLKLYAEESLRSVAVGASILFCVALTLSLPLFVRNQKLYGQPIPVQAFKQEFAGTKKATDMIGRHMADDLWTGELQQGEEMSRAGYVRLVANWTFRTFFAAYTPLQIAPQGLPLFEQPPIFYVPYLVLGLAAMVGLTRLHFRNTFTSTQLAFVRMMIPFTLLVAVTFGGFIWTYFQAQGRYLYPAMLPMSILGALGLKALLPAKKWEAGALAILILLLLLAAAFLFLFVQPTYSEGLPHVEP